MEIQERKRRFFTRAAGAVVLAIGIAAVPVLVAQEQNEQQEQQDPQNVPFRPFGPGGNTQPAAPAYQPAPPTLTLPAGTVIAVRLSQWLSSDQNRAGDLFDAELLQPVVVDGWVVARKGQTVLGRVGVAEKAKAGGGKSRLGVELSQLILVDGQQLPLRTQLMQSTGRSNAGQNAATLGATTVTGAAIGGAVHGGEGAGIGAAIGAAAGIIGVLLTPGKPTVIPAEAQLTFRLESPVTVSTERSSQAFLPVSPQDFGTQDYDYYRNRLRSRPQRVPPPAVYPPPYYRNYYYDDWGYYPGWGFSPGPYFSFYGFYGGRHGFGRGHFRR